MCYFMACIYITSDTKHKNIDFIQLLYKIYVLTRNKIAG